MTTRNYMVALLMLGLLTPRMFAHGVHLPTPTVADVRAMQPPIPGSLELGRALHEHLRQRLDATQLVRLDAIGQNLLFIDQISGNVIPDADPALTNFYRWRLETNVLALVDSLPDLITLDFRPGAPVRDMMTPIALDQQFNLLVLKVITGTGAVHCSVQEVDMLAEYDTAIEFPGGAEKRAVDIYSNATTYVLLKLQQVSPGETLMHLAFRNHGEKQPYLWSSLRWQSTPFGNVGITVNDETGQPTPVLMRLTSARGQRLWEPPNAVNLRPLMNEVAPLPPAGPGRGLPIYMPGGWAGYYWVVPGPFEMALPEGDWEVRLLHGLEYAPLQATFSIRSGAWTRVTYPLQRGVDMPARGWISGDEHIHARLMSSDDAARLITATCAADIHVGNILEMGSWMRSFYPQRGFGRDFRVQRGDHWLVPGIEDPRGILGHAIGLNLAARVRSLQHYTLHDWWANEIHKQGGLYGHTHVGEQALMVEREVALFTPMGIVDFNSMLQNRLGTTLIYDMLNLGFPMTCSAGSDTPYGSMLGCVRMYAYCGTNAPWTPDRYFDAVKRGTTFVSTGPMLELHVDGKLPGSTIGVTTNRPVHVQVKAYGLRGFSAPAGLRLVQLGKVIAQVSVTNDAQDELALELDVDSGYGSWLAAHAFGRNGSEAHTSPVYVVRDGFRFWNVNEAARLLKKQLAVLDDLEAAVAECVRLRAANPQSLDFWSRWPAEQQAELQARITRVRGIYTQLGVTLATEQKQRAGISPAGPQR